MPLNKNLLAGYALGLLLVQTVLAQNTATTSNEVESMKPESPSFSSMATEMGKYQHKLYLQIGSRWNTKVQKSMSEIGKDRVVIKFHVNPDGKIENISIVEGNPESKLAKISKEAILESSGSCGAFSEAFKKEKPGGFDWQLAYKIY
jgi:hypothetical protein